MTSREMWQLAQDLQRDGHTGWAIMTRLCAEVIHRLDDQTTAIRELAEAVRGEEE